MSTVITDIKQGVAYFSKLLRRHEEGLLITGVAGSSKTTWANLLGRHTGQEVFSLDTIGSISDGQWLIDFSKVPDGVTVVEGISDNIYDIKDHVEEGNLAVVVIEPDPAIFLHAMRARAEHEDHEWVEVFKQQGSMSSSQARKLLSKKSQSLREKFADWANKVYMVTPNWIPELASETGRAENLADKSNGSAYFSLGEEVKSE